MKWLSKLLAVLVLAVIYWFPIRRLLHRWGTTPEGLARRCPACALMSSPTNTDKPGR